MGSFFAAQKEEALGGKVVPAMSVPYVCSRAKCRRNTESKYAQRKQRVVQGAFFTDHACTHALTKNGSIYFTVGGRGTSGKGAVGSFCARTNGVGGDGSGWFGQGGGGNTDLFTDLALFRKRYGFSPRKSACRGRNNRGRKVVGAGERRGGVPQCTSKHHTRVEGGQEGGFSRLGNVE